MKTVALFFTRGTPTRRICYYQLAPGRPLGKTNPLSDAESCDLSVKNPNAPAAEALRAPEEIIDAILARDAETAEILERIRGLL